MADKKKRLIMKIMERTGRTMAGAHNLLRNAKAGDARAQKIVDRAKASLSRNPASEDDAAKGEGNG